MTRMHLKNVTSVIVCLWLTGCVVMYPKDGELVDPDRGIGFSGFITRSDMGVVISACDDGNRCERIGEATSGSDVIANFEGTGIYRWRTLIRVPERMWIESTRSGKRTKIRAQTWIGIERTRRTSTGGTVVTQPNFDLITVDKNWAQCASGVDSALAFGRECKSDNHPYALLYSEDYCPDWPDLSLTTSYNETTGMITFASPERVPSNIRNPTITEETTGVAVDCELGTVSRGTAMLSCEVHRSDLGFGSECEYRQWRSEIRFATWRINYPATFFEFPGCVVEDRVASFAIPREALPDGCPAPAACNLFGSAGSCPFGEGCYLRFGDRRAECLRVGDGTTGDACVTNNSCRPPHVCVGLEAKACQKLCSIAGSSSIESCPTGQHCQAYAYTPAGVGVCTPD